MFDGIVAFLQSLPPELYVFIISVLPLIELRGAVPVGAALGLPFYLNFLVAVLGNMLPIPFVLLFIPKILDFLAKFKIFRPMVEWLRKKAEKNRKKIIKSAECRVQNAECGAQNAEFGEMSAERRAQNAELVERVSALSCVQNSKYERMTLGALAALMLFVAIPLPGTGAWTGALVAALFKMPRLHAFLAILSGVLICGVIMCLASYGVLGFLSFLL